MATMNVSLPDLMKEWVEEQIKTGHYSNASDIEAILPRSVLDFRVERTESYFQFLTHCLELLGDNPEMGSTVDDIRQGYRCFLHESHVIFYTHDEQAILIVRILHKRMDVVRSLQD